MDRMKYIAFEGAVMQEIFIFPANRSHAEVANLLRVAGGDLISAGIFSYDPINGMTCWGASVDLCKVARPEEDKALLHRLLGVA